RRLTIAAAYAALLSLLLLLPAAPVQGASVRPGTPGTRYYLSLGDSLAQGMQPDAGGLTRDTAQGYADQLYSLERRRIPGLTLVKRGCGGETSSSFLSGRGNPDALILGCNQPWRLADGGGGTLPQGTPPSGRSRPADARHRRQRSGRLRD